MNYEMVPLSEWQCIGRQWLSVCFALWLHLTFLAYAVVIIVFWIIGDPGYHMIIVFVYLSSVVTLFMFDWMCEIEKEYKL